MVKHLSFALYFTILVSTCRNEPENLSRTPETSKAPQDEEPLPPRLTLFVDSEDLSEEDLFQIEQDFATSYSTEESLKLGFLGSIFKRSNKADISTPRQPTVKKTKVPIHASPSASGLPGSSRPIKTNNPRVKILKTKDVDGFFFEQLKSPTTHIEFVGVTKDTAKPVPERPGTLQINGSLVQEVQIQGLPRGIQGYRMMGLEPGLHPPPRLPHGPLMDQTSLVHVEKTIDDLFVANGVIKKTKEIEGITVHKLSNDVARVKLPNGGGSYIIKKVSTLELEASLRVNHLQGTVDIQGYKMLPDGRTVMIMEDIPSKPLTTNQDIADLAENLSEIHKIQAHGDIHGGNLYGSTLADWGESRLQPSEVTPIKQQRAYNKAAADTLYYWNEFSPARRDVFQLGATILDSPRYFNRKADVSGGDGIVTTSYLKNIDEIEASHGVTPQTTMLRRMLGNEPNITMREVQRAFSQ